MIIFSKISWKISQKLKNYLIVKSSKIILLNYKCLVKLFVKVNEYKIT